MKKTLIYYHFVSKDKKLDKLHFLLLEHYAHVFDEVKFCISIDDTEDSETIKDIEEKILHIFSKKNVNITFYVYKNNRLFCEAEFFYNELASKITEYELIFYAHGKGMQTGKDRESMQHWIVSMYYYCLEYVEEMEQKLTEDNINTSFGHFLFSQYNHFYNESHFQKAYCGTYFWLNTKKLYDYLVDQNITIPKPYDRYYSENFLSMLTCDGYCSHDNKTIRNTDLCMDLYENNLEVINMLYPNDTDYLTFYNKIIKEWETH